MTALLCFPNQLFDVPYWKELIQKTGAKHMIVLDDPVFYGDRKGNKQGLPQRLYLNQLRICYQLASVEVFVNALHNSGLFDSVTHLSFDALFEKNAGNAYAALKKYVVVHAYDPEDHLLRHRLEKHNIHVTFHPSPSFIMSQEDLEDFMKGREGKRLQHSVFFEDVKMNINYLVHVKSHDAMNRKPFDKKDALPEPPYVQRMSMQYSDAQWQELWKYVESHPFFKSHAKPLDKQRAVEHLKQLPLCAKDARAWLKKFLTERFGSFGKYEDAIVSNSPYMFHSGISMFLNNGLLTPSEVLVALQKLKNPLMQNTEAFVRQLFGWREYSRLYYKMVAQDIYRRNVFGFGKGKLGKEWYVGGTGIAIVDQAIKDAWDTGYLHHIRRLMVVSNYMMLNEVHPDNIYKWMYEFSLDSWDWVMVFNCYSMAAWSDGGHGMRKPYISSATYLLKMSDEPHGPWEQKWNQLFRAFLEKYRGLLQHTPYASLLSRMLR